LELRLHKKNREEQAREVNNLSREETSGGKSQAAPAGSGASSSTARGASDASKGDKRGERKASKGRGRSKSKDHKGSGDDKTTKADGKSGGKGCVSFTDTPEGCKKKDCPFVHKKLSEKEQAELRAPSRTRGKSKGRGSSPDAKGGKPTKGGVHPLG
jgi:hypothetical protein